MKTFSIRAIVLLLAASTVMISCKKDEPAPAAPAATTLSDKIQGDWAISKSQGVEWQEGVGIITPLADEPDLLGAMIRIEDDMFTVKEISGAVMFGPVAFTLDETENEITIPDLGTFQIEDLVLNTSMDWDQNEPKNPGDYEPQAGCGCNLFFQKFWTLSKLP